MILNWIALFILSLTLSIFISFLNDWIELKPWPRWQKTLAKTGIWMTAIIGLVILALIFAILSGGSNSKSSK